MSAAENSINRETGRQSRGLQVAVVGLVLLALALFALQAVRMFRSIDMAEWIYLAIQFGSWVLVLLGNLQVRHYHAAFARAMICAGLMLIVILVEVVNAYQGRDAAGSGQTFYQFGIMLPSYITLIGFCYTYYSMLRGGAVLAFQENDTRLFQRCNGRGRLSFVLIFLCLLLIPASALFEPFVKYCATAILGLSMLIVQLRMCMLLLSVYDMLYGKELEE